MLAVPGIIVLKEKLTPKAPIVKDWDAFNRDSAGKSPKEIRKMLYSGKY
jgi:hypothetical protein